VITEMGGRVVVVERLAAEMTPDQHKRYLRDDDPDRTAGAQNEQRFAGGHADLTCAWRRRWGRHPRRGF
jgi:hypothetical protein